MLRLSSQNPALLFALALIVVSLIGCGGEDTPASVGVSRAADGVRAAVQQEYRAENTGATLHETSGGGRLLEVILVNPGGDETTTRASARTVARAAQAQYQGPSPDTVMVSFEYSSVSDSAEVGFHRRYHFASGNLSAPASSSSDTTQG